MRLASFCSAQPKDWEERLFVLSALGVLNKERGFYNEALPYYKEALDIAYANYASEDPGLAQTLTLYAELLRKQGLVDESLELHQKALTIRLSSSSQDKVAISESQTFIGCCYSATKNYEKASVMHEQALQLREKCLNPAHPLLSESLNYVGETLQYTDKAKPALPCLMRALNIRESVFGKSHPAVAHVLGNLAAVHSKLGRLHEAELHFQVRKPTLIRHTHCPKIALANKHCAEVHPHLRGFLQAGPPQLDPQLDRVQQAAGDAKQVRKSAGALLKGAGDPQEEWQQPNC